MTESFQNRSLSGFTGSLFVHRLYPELRCPGTEDPRMGTSMWHEDFRSSFRFLPLPYLRLPPFTRFSFLSPPSQVMVSFSSFSILTFPGDLNHWSSRNHHKLSDRYPVSPYLTPFLPELLCCQTFRPKIFVSILFFFPNYSKHPILLWRPLCLSTFCPSPIFVFSVLPKRISFFYRLWSLTSFNPLSTYLLFVEFLEWMIRTSLLTIRRKTLERSLTLCENDVRYVSLSRWFLSFRCIAIILWSTLSLFTHSSRLGNKPVGHVWGSDGWVLTDVYTEIYWVSSPEGDKGPQGCEMGLITVENSSMTREWVSG